MVYGWWLSALRQSGEAFEMWQKAREDLGNVSCSLSYVVASEKVPPTPTGDGSSTYSLMGIYLGALWVRDVFALSHRCGVHHRTLPASDAELWRPEIWFV